MSGKEKLFNQHSAVIWRYLGIEADDALEMAEQTEVQVRRPISGCRGR